MAKKQVTSSIDVLREILVRLNKAIPVNEDHSLLFQSWSRVLGGGDRSETDVLEAINDIARLVSKTEEQVDSSLDLDDDTRLAAMTALRSAKSLLSFDALKTSASSFRMKVTPDETGKLGLLAGALRAEFPVVKLTPDDKEGIKARLNEILELLDSDNFPIDLRELARRNIKSLLWWLEHNEILEPQQLLLKAGSLSILGHQLSASKPEGSEAAEKIKEKSKGVVQTLARLVSFSIKNEEAIEKLGHFAHSAIEGASQML